MKAKYPVSFLYLYVLVTGASVMALELAASRFLAPYYGTSTVVWANIIGLVLLSLSLGYWVGGKLADRWPDGRLLMTISLASGALTSLLPLWGALIFPLLSAGILNTPAWIVICSFFAVLIVFAPPVFLLAMVSPFAIRLVADEDEAVNVGKVAGNLYAFSTLGSLIGTFGTALLTIPFLGSRETIFLWSAALIAISAWGLRHTRRWWLALLLALPLVVYVLTNGQSAATDGERIVWQKDTLYQHVRVIRNEAGDTYLVYNEGGGVQSVRRHNDALHEDDYYDDYLLLPFLTENPRQMLVLGSAGGTIPRLVSKYIKPLYPDLRITGVEIDPDVVKIGPRFFGVQPDDADIVIQDARVFVSSTDHRYDIVIVDCYSNEVYIPFHLSTVEFFRTVRDRLTENGIIALNVNATSPDSRLLASMAKTVREAFDYTYLVKVRGPYNYMLIGAKHPLDLERLKRIDAASPLEQIRREWPEHWEPLGKGQPAGALLLTDNRAPTEMLTDTMIFSMARQQ